MSWFEITTGNFVDNCVELIKAFNVEHRNKIEIALYVAEVEFSTKIFVAVLHWIIFIRLETHFNSGNAEKFVLAFIDTASGKLRKGRQTNGRLAEPFPPL